MSLVERATDYGLTVYRNLRQRYQDLTYPGKVSSPTFDFGQFEYWQSRNDIGSILIAVLDLGICFIALCCGVWGVVDYACHAIRLLVESTQLGPGTVTERSPSC